MTGRDDSPAMLPVMAEALDWLARLASGEATTADARALDQWRARSPEHDAAFREVAAYRRMALALPPVGVAGTVTPLHRRPAVSRRAFVAGGAIAASVAGVMVVRPPLGLWPSLAELLADHRTGPGERYAFAPSPGVEVEMNTRTSLSLVNGGDSVRILDGETFITVAQRRTAFTVLADGGQIAARTPASFNVQLLGGQLCVVCTAGSVESARGGASTTLGQGEQIVYAADGAARQSRTDVDVALAWRRGLLIFDGTSLAEVITQINRYRPGRIILANSAIGARPVNGVFHTAQIENTVAQIQQLLDVRLTRLPGDVVLVG